MSRRATPPRHIRDPQTDRPHMSELDYFAAAPAAMKSWMAMSSKINASLDPTLVRLVEIRASQINGCANCINMHTAHAREGGEIEQRLYLLPAWRDAPC